MNKTKSPTLTSLYNSFSDSEKVSKNWLKAIGLYSRGEWSVAILRCGTCLELAVNFAIREEFVKARKLPLRFVDKLLLNANGIHNKYQNLYLPIMNEYDEIDDLKKLWTEIISVVNKERNDVVHKGEFRNKIKATMIMQNTRAALTELMALHGCESRIAVFEE